MDFIWEVWRSDVFEDLVDFGERAFNDNTGDLSSNQQSSDLSDADAPLFILRQNHFTTTGSSDGVSDESNSWGDPFITPLMD